MKKNVLFLCVANSARSQIAEGLARALLSEYVDVQSAGSEPSHVHPLALEAMSEMGVDISHQYSKSVDDIDLDEIDYIVTLCAEEYCPYVSRKIIKLHWPINDPAKIDNSQSTIDGFRVVREEIKVRLLNFKNTTLH